jgi:hypothetical protein
MSGFAVFLCIVAAGAVAWLLLFFAYCIAKADEEHQLKLIARGVQRALDEKERRS